MHSTLPYSNLKRAAKSALCLTAISLILSACVSIPNTPSKSAVIERIISSDEYLKNTAVKNTVIKDTQQLEVKLAHSLAQSAQLTESDAIFLALNNNAAFKALLVDLKLAKADLVNAGLLPNPELLYAFGAINKPYKYAIDLPIEVFWLRPIRLRNMKNEADATTFRLTQAGQNLIRDVRIAYAQSVLARERLAVAQSSHLLRENIYQLSTKRLAAGDLNGKDILIAKNDAIIAKRDWQLAQYDTQIKAEILLNLLGAAHNNRSIQLSASVTPACQAVDIDHLLTKSLTQRADIVAAQFLIEAAKEKVKLSTISWFKFSATADATSGQSGHELGPAIRSTIPIANQNQGAVGRTEAELERAQLNLEALKQQATLESRTAHIQYQQACHEWTVLQNELMPSMQKTLELTQQAYTEGDISYLQTLEVNRQFVDTQFRQVQLKAELVGKWAELLRNLGTKING